MSEPVTIMAAPSGARKTRADHARLPVSIGDSVAEAAAELVASLVNRLRADGLPVASAAQACQRLGMRSA